MLRFLQAIVVIALVHASQAHAETVHILTSGGPREAILLPAPAKPAPILIVLHGATVTAAQTVRNTGFSEAASVQGFAAIFPQGLLRQWNDGREKGAVSEVDDVGFVRALIEDLVERGEAERNRIYLAGISNGGMMTFRLLCEEAHLFAGAATIIANMPAPTGAACKPAKAVPLIMFNGTGDPIVPYAGGAVGFKGMRGDVWGAEETARFFAGQAGCIRSREIQVPRPSSYDLIITRLEWGVCSERAGVALFRFEGGGHQVPGGKTFLPALLGPNTQRVDAAKTIVELFAQLQLGSR